MQADEITLTRLSEIKATLERGRESVTCLMLEVGRSEINPEHAAAVINNMMANLNALTK
jgi:hypothetical protein